MKRTCFVISPIGKDGSETRQDADEFLQFLVEPALERYEFDVVRADKIPRPSVITSDIIRLVQEADICIIDITNSNPNVFYECGRRHETGRPFIQVIKAGRTADIPFDVSGIRTLEYDVSTTAKARASVKDLQAYIDEVIKSGFGDRAAGYTLASIGDAIDRVERKVNALSSERTNISNSNSKSKLSRIDILTSHPEKAFDNLLEAGDFEGAFSILPKVRRASGEKEYIRTSGLLARAGYEPAARSLLEIAKGIAMAEQPNIDLFSSANYSLKEYYANTGRGKEGIPVLVELFELTSKSDGFDVKARAESCNLIGMLAWRCDDHETGQKYEELTVTLNSSSPAYWYNKALTHQKLKQSEKLESTLVSLSKCQNLRDSHREILAKHGISPA